MPKKAIYYEDAKGRRPAEEFINALELKVRAKVLARIEFLEKHWHELKRPYVDSLKEGLYELRVIFSGNQFRVLYAYMFKDYIVLLHGIIKKTKVVLRDDILQAVNRMNDFQERYNKGKVKLPRID